MPGPISNPARLSAPSGKDAGLVRQDLLTQRKLRTGKTDHNKRSGKHARHLANRVKRSS